MIFIILNVDRSARSEHAVHPTLGPWGVGGSAGPVAADLKGDFGRVQNPYITIDWSLESGDCLEASRGRRGGKRRVAKRFLIWVRSGFTHGRIAHFTGKIVSDHVGNDSVIETLFYGGLIPSLWVSRMPGSTPLASEHLSSNGRVLCACLDDARSAVPKLRCHAVQTSA